MIHDWVYGKINQQRPRVWNYEISYLMNMKAMIKMGDPKVKKLCD